MSTIKGKKTYLSSNQSIIEISLCESNPPAAKWKKNHKIVDSIGTDLFSGFKEKKNETMFVRGMKSQYIHSVGDHRGCDLFQQSIPTIKRRLGVMLLEQTLESIKLFLNFKKPELFYLS